MDASRRFRLQPRKPVHIGNQVLTPMQAQVLGLLAQRKSLPLGAFQLDDIWEGAGVSRNVAVRLEFRGFAEIRDGHLHLTEFGQLLTMWPDFPPPVRFDVLRKRPGVKHGAARRYFDAMMADGDREAGCWVWPYALTTGGYGRVSRRLAHRLAFEIAFGSKPNICRHACDNRRCFNPAHLRDGDYADNVRDMMERGRGRNAFGRTG